MITAVARDARPPAALIRVLNPVLRFVLRTPLSRLVRPFALLEFAGRRSGRALRIPVGWHDLDGVPVVFTPASWRANFVGGREVTVRFRGRTRSMTGTLTSDPQLVADHLNELFQHGTSPRNVGIVVPRDHTMTAADVAAVDRAMIAFTS